MTTSPYSTNWIKLSSLWTIPKKTDGIFVSVQKVFLVISLTLSFSGCSTYVQEPSGEAYLNGIHVIAQVCLPNTTGAHLDPFDITFSHITRYGPQGQYRSISGGGLNSSWRTKSNQLVFEQETGRQIDIVAIVVSYVNRHGAYEMPEATFGPPEHIPDNGWSQWIAPITLERDTRLMDAGTRPWYKLVHGKEVSAQAVEDSAPKIRYRFIRVADYQLPFIRKGKGDVEAIPPCY